MPSKNKQAGIFSSPDLTVDTEKIAVHSTASPTVKPDIPVRRSQHDKRKITFIIIIVAALILMGIVVLTLVMSSRSSTNQGIGNRDSMSLKESLNRYVGFLVSGKTDTAAFTDADFDPHGSKLYSVVYSGETNTINSYFSEAQVFLDSFLKQAQAAYTSTSSPEEELVLSLAESNKLQLGVIEEYAVMEEFDMTGSYISLGATGFQQEVKNTMMVLCKVQTKLCARLRSQKYRWLMLYHRYLGLTKIMDVSAINPLWNPAQKEFYGRTKCWRHRMFLLPLKTVPTRMLTDYL